MPADLPDSPSLPYVVEPRFTLRAIGRWKSGGVLEVGLDGRLAVTISLAAGEWDVAAMLIGVGMRTAAWDWAGAFMTAPELARGLYQRSRRGNSDPANIPRYVYRLRKSIAEKLNGQVEDPRQWTRGLIENHRFLGYRIGLPPENLDLRILRETGTSPGDDP
jgi:hypothetical protein